MIRLLLIRHAATSWNRNKRIQGLSDIPIDDKARREVGQWRIPEGFDGAQWVSSPLQRAIETARLLGGAPQPEPRLVEMDWGKWEGETLEDLRLKLGDTMTLNEEQGLDFRPPDGESPRNVQDRLRPWLKDIARTSTKTIAVTHKGVIRAVMALATGWNMTGKPPSRILNGKGHIFCLDPDGVPSVDRLNIDLDEHTEEE